MTSALPVKAPTLPTEVQDPGWQYKYTCKHLAFLSVIFKHLPCKKGAVLVSGYVATKYSLAKPEITRCRAANNNIERQKKHHSRMCFKFYKIIIRCYTIFQLCKCKLAQTSGKKQCLAAATCGAARVDLFQPGAGSWHSPPEAYATDATVTACNLKLLPLRLARRGFGQRT